MSEIKGQLLGIILVLMLFGVVSAAAVSIVNSLTGAAEDKVKDTIDDLEKIQPETTGSLLSY